MTNTRYSRLVFTGGMLLLFLFLLFSAPLLVGTRHAIHLALNTILPSLFPFLVLSELLSTAAHGIRLPFSTVFCKLFRLPASCLLPFFLGALCGFPVGVSAVCDLHRRGELTSEEAARAAALCANTGPAFSIAGIGGALFGSATLGLCFYLIQIGTAIILGTLAARNAQAPVNITYLPGNSAPISFSAILCHASLSMVTILGTVIFFGTISTLPALVLPKNLSVFFTAFLELGNGAEAAAALPREVGIPLTAFALSFSGVSVLAQSAALLAPQNIPLSPLLRRKLWQGILAAVVAILIFNF